MAVAEVHPGHAYPHPAAVTKLRKEDEMNQITLKVLPPMDHDGARYDWIDEDEPGLDGSLRHSINCRCADCDTFDDEDGF